MRKTLSLTLLIFLLSTFISTGYLTANSNQKINSYGIISYRQSQYEVELLRSTDKQNFLFVNNVEVLGIINSTSRYGVAVDAWENGLWTVDIAADTSLLDRFMIQCSEDAAIHLSTEEWVEWVAPILNDFTFPEQSIDWVPSDAHLWYSADFEKTYILNPDDTSWNGQFSDWTIDHMIARAHKMAIVHDPTNPGNEVLRILYGEKTDYDKPNRPQVYSYHFFKEIYFSGWYYFPTDFEVVNWYHLGASFLQWSQYYADLYDNGIVITGGGTIDSNLDFTVEIHDFPEHIPSSRRYLVDHVKVGTIPLGRWFNLRFHLILDDAKGMFEFWFDKPIGNEQPDITYVGKTFEEIPDGPSTQITFVNHYSDLGNPEKYQYSDNFEVWTRG